MHGLLWRRIFSLRCLISRCPSLIARDNYLDRVLSRFESWLGLFLTTISYVPNLSVASLRWIQPETEVGFVSIPPPWDPSAANREKTSGGMSNQSKNRTLHRSETGFVKPGSTWAGMVQGLKPLLDTTTTYGGGDNDSSLLKQRGVEMENASGSGIVIEQMQPQQQLRRYHSSPSFNLLPHNRSRHPRSNNRQQLAHRRHQTLGKINAGKGTAKTKGHGRALTPVYGESRLVKGGTRGLYVQVCPLL